MKSLSEMKIKIFGDGAIPFAMGLENSMELRDVQIHRFGDDLAVEGYCKDSRFSLTSLEEACSPASSKK